MHPIMHSSLISTLLFLQIIILSPLLVINTANAADEVKLATELQRALHQKGQPYLECISAKMGRTFQTTSVPWARAQLGTERGAYDGFFMASKNSKRDRYAVRSEPFFSIEWLYIVRKGSGLTPDDPEFAHKSFAANKGSARLMWLLDKFEKKEITSGIINSTDSANTLKMLSLGRIDVNLENNENLKNAFELTGLNPTNFQTFIAKSKPVGVYFGKDFLKRDPGFMEEFNTAVKACRAR